MKSRKRAVIALTLVAGAFLRGLLPGTVEGQPADLCPEPNDELQRGCYLVPGEPVVGFISGSSDADTYRFEVLDFGVHVRVELVEMPAPYRVNLFRWNGARHVEGGQRALETTLSSPGSYYVTVDSVSGEFNDAVPYRLQLTTAYANGMGPELLSALDLGSGPPSMSTPDADYLNEDGRLRIDLKKSGTQNAASAAFWSSYWPEFATSVADFTLALDARAVAGSAAGYGVRFRIREPDSFYYATFDASRRRFIVGKRVSGVTTVLQDWRDLSPTIATDSVNRIVIRAVGSEMIVNVDGTEVARLGDDAIRAGAFDFGAFTWAGPASVRFDNVLLTAGAPPAAPGVELLRDDFADEAHGLLSRVPSNRNVVDVGYDNGAYRLRRPDTPGLRASYVTVPVSSPDSDIAVDVDLVEPSPWKQYGLVCRDQAARGGSTHYRLTVEPSGARFRLDRFDRGVPTELWPWRDSPAIRRDGASNRLELGCRGTTITAVVNGVGIGTVDDATYRRGRLAVVTARTTDDPVAVEIRLRNLVVTKR
ncbi:MAG: hypothetical protein U0821_13010 [Chloroflexota bacterium]